MVAPGGWSYIKILMISIPIVLLKLPGTDAGKNFGGGLKKLEFFEDSELSDECIDFTMILQCTYTNPAEKILRFPKIAMVSVNPVIQYKDYFTLYLKEYSSTKKKNTLLFHSSQNLKSLDYCVLEDLLLLFIGFPLPTEDGGLSFLCTYHSSNAYYDMQYNFKKFILSSVLNYINYTPINIRLGIPYSKTIVIPDRQQLFNAISNTSPDAIYKIEKADLNRFMVYATKNREIISVCKTVFSTSFKLYTKLIGRYTRHSRRVPLCLYKFAYFSLGLLTEIEKPIVTKRNLSLILTCKAGAIHGVLRGVFRRIQNLLFYIRVAIRLYMTSVFVCDKKGQMCYILVTENAAEYANKKRILRHYEKSVAISIIVHFCDDKEMNEQSARENYRLGTHESKLFDG
ncbi:hypothetical protein AGLY_009273 [Aphis glycines]|uniref:Uncharacterized protein n=1 Tax=Aphis glycines TaxID=307491 RepID=A0A6G0TIM2_APHGL|nr:hypothetical protein AGLY_009273 [Aphis glycines]